MTARPTPQIRWVHYYERYIRSGGLAHNPLASHGEEDQIAPVYRPKTLCIRHVRLITVPQFDPSIFGGGCDPYVCMNMMVMDAEKKLKAESGERWQGTTTTTLCFVSPPISAPLRPRRLVCRPLSLT